MKTATGNLRTGLVLGRVSNLPTVWSNLTAGWLLAGGGHDLARLAPVLLGGSFLYVGGMYLNDFCDAGFDADYRKDRPIPAGEISRRAVGVLAVIWFASGIGCLSVFGWVTTLLAVVLLGGIMLYDFRHKKVEGAPVVMGACRFLLYPLAASAYLGASIPRYAVLAGIALGIYVAGITYLARGESRPEKPARWALVLLILPVLLPQAWGAMHGFSLASPTLFSLLFLAWLAWLLVPLWRKINPSIGRVVSGLLAGIVLSDMIAVSPAIGFQAAWLFPLFVLALFLQRTIPAT